VKKCEKGLEALRSYRVEMDTKTKTPRKTPLHDWSSHSADAFRELAVQLFDYDEFRKRRLQTGADMDYDPTASPSKWGPIEVRENPLDPWAEPDRRQVKSDLGWTPY
jgi:hypothetical protein